MMSSSGGWTRIEPSAAAPAGAAPVAASPEASTETNPLRTQGHRPQHCVVTTHIETPTTTCGEKPTTSVFVAVTTTKDINALGSGEVRAAMEVTMANGCLLPPHFLI